MGYFAEVDVNGKVLRVVVCDSNQWLIDNLGGKWVETFQDGSVRKNYAGEGMTYDSVRDAFIAPKTYPSWLLDETTCQWQAPVLMPTDGKMYSWDEANLAWEAII